MLSFQVNPVERQLIEEIGDRAFRLQQGPARLRRQRIDFEMDVTATHASGNPLDLNRLLAADDFNFAHDVFGIARHLNRETGQLEDHFSPRFSAKADIPA